MTDNWATPSWLMEMFKDWYDPCPISKGTLRDSDGLGDWKDRTFVNPPYSKPKEWVIKAIEENKKGKMIVMLMKMDTSTQWFKMLQEAGAQFLWFNGRLKFSDTGKPANFPSMLVIMKGGNNGI